MAHLYNAPDPVGDPGHICIVHAAGEERLSPILQLQHLFPEFYPPASQEVSCLEVPLQKLGLWETSNAMYIPSHVLTLKNAPDLYDR